MKSHRIALYVILLINLGMSLYQMWTIWRNYLFAQAHHVAGFFGMWILFLLCWPVTAVLAAYVLITSDRKR